MAQTLIKWRLREVMARYQIKAIDLAREIDVSANAVSNLRKGNSMPRLDGESLNRLCNALNNLAIDLDEEITPMTLIEYTRDLEPDDNRSKSPLVSSRQERKTETSKRDSDLPRSKMLSVVKRVKSA